MEAKIWHIYGPCGPRPLDCLSHEEVDATTSNWWQWKKRPGYSLAEAAALVLEAAADLDTSFSNVVSNFALWGRREDEDLYSPINPDIGLQLHSVERSEMIDSTGGCWRDVRLIPPIYAPNVHEFVSGYLFEDAFDELVFSDAETSAAFKIALDVAPWLSPLPDPTFKIAEGALFLQQCSRVICSNAMGDERANREEIGIALGVYPSLVGWKIIKFVEILAQGRLQSDGLHRSNPTQRCKIDQTFWRRPEYAVDLLKGDLVNIETGETDWRAIVLRAPHLVAGPAPKIADATAAGSPFERPRGDDDDLVRLSEAAKSLGLDSDTLRKRADRARVKKKTGLGTYVPRWWVSKQPEFKGQS